MNEVTTKTNNHWRDFLFGDELPEKALSDFDYINEDDIALHRFIKYKGGFYDIGEFMSIPNNMSDCHGFEEWNAYHADSFFTGILIKISEDGEQYKIATWMS